MCARAQNSLPRSRSRPQRASPHQSQGNLWVPSGSLASVLESLTKGECRIVELVARGWTNQEVADHLSLRTKTVEWTLTNVYRKLNLRSRTELALKLAGLAALPNPGVSLDAEREVAPVPLPCRADR